MKRALFALIAAAACVPALADQALATAKNCMACHAVDKKLVGPAYKSPPNTPARKMPSTSWPSRS
jgi:cytochrome c